MCLRNSWWISAGRFQYNASSEKSVGKLRLRKRPSGALFRELDLAGIRLYQDLVPDMQVKTVRNRKEQRIRRHTTSQSYVQQEHCIAFRLVIVDGMMEAMTINTVRKLGAAQSSRYSGMPPLHGIGKMLGCATYRENRQRKNTQEAEHAFAWNHL